MRRLVLVLIELSTLILLALPTLVAAGPGRHPLAEKAEASFFATFNGNPQQKDAPLRPLLAAALTDPADARSRLLLGLNHLWIAAEGDKRDPLVLEHLMLAERYLARAEQLDPKDRRIPSWLVPVRLSLAGFDGRKAQQEEVLRDLFAAYAEDPSFHSFTVALVGMGSDRSSPEFRRGLEALRSTTSTCAADTEDPSCKNRPRWPHNQEAYLTFFADYELEAGQVDRARELLLRARQNPDYPLWPFRQELEDRLKNLEARAALYANADPGDDPRHLMSVSGSLACQSCHLGP